MSSVSFIGLGGMARALAARAVAGGNAVEVIGRDAARAEGLPPRSAGGPRPGHSALPAGDMVVLAVPYTSDTVFGHLLAQGRSSDVFFAGHDARAKAQLAAGALDGLDILVNNAGGASGFPRGTASILVLK